MYELNTAPVGEEWLTLIDAVEGRPALRVQMRAVAPSTLQAARAALGDAGHPVEDFARDAGFDAFCRELCRRGIIAWEGVGQHGAPAPLTRENIDALLADSGLLARLQALYVYPYLARESEKNALPPSSAGTLPGKTGAKAIAADARKPAKPALTSSTRPKPARAKRSGR